MGLIHGWLSQVIGATFLESHAPEIHYLARGVYFCAQIILWRLMWWNATFHFYPFISLMKILYGMVFRLLRGTKESFCLLVTCFLSKNLDKCGTLATHNSCAIYKSPYSYGLLFFMSCHFNLIFSPHLKHIGTSFVGHWMAKMRWSRVEWSGTNVKPRDSLKTSMKKCEVLFLC